MGVTIEQIGLWTATDASGREKCRALVLPGGSLVISMAYGLTPEESLSLADYIYSAVDVGRETREVDPCTATTT